MANRRPSSHPLDGARRRLSRRQSSLSSTASSFAQGTSFTFQDGEDRPSPSPSPSPPPPQQQQQRQAGGEDVPPTLLTPLDLSTLRLKSLRRSYSRSLLTRFYDELVIPAFPIDEERDDLDDWIACLDPDGPCRRRDRTGDCGDRQRREANANGETDAWWGPGMDVVLLLCDPVAALPVADCVTTPIILAGAAVEHYRVARVGLLSYIVVDPIYRGLSLAKTLHDAALRSLRSLHQEAGLADRNGCACRCKCGCEGPRLRAVFAETNTLNAGDAPPDVIGKRHVALQKLGYNRLRFPYAQPPLCEGGEPFEPIMLLAYRGPRWEDGEENDCAAEDDAWWDGSGGGITDHRVDVDEVEEKKGEGGTDDECIFGDDQERWFPSGSMDVSIPFAYVTDFYQSVYGYGPDDRKRFEACRYYRLAMWFADRNPIVSVGDDDHPPWDDFTAGVREEYENEQEGVT